MQQGGLVLEDKLERLLAILNTLEENPEARAETHNRPFKIPMNVEGKGKEPLTIEGVVEEVDIEENHPINLMQHHLKLYVTILSKSGRLYNTFMEKHCFVPYDAHHCVPLRQLERTLRPIKWDNGIWKRPIVKVVIGNMLNPDDQLNPPLYPVLSQYEAVGLFTGNDKAEFEEYATLSNG